MFRNMNVAAHIHSFLPHSYAMGKNVTKYVRVYKLTVSIIFCLLILFNASSKYDLGFSDGVVSTCENFIVLLIQFYYQSDQCNFSVHLFSVFLAVHKVLYHIFQHVQSFLHVWRHYCHLAWNVVCISRSIFCLFELSCTNWTPTLPIYPFIATIFLQNYTITFLILCIVRVIFTLKRRTVLHSLYLVNFLSCTIWLSSLPILVEWQDTLRVQCILIKTKV